MKKIFGFLLCALTLTTRVYAEADIPTEKQYTFDRTNVATVLAEFIEDAALAKKAADRYNELSREGSEKISAVDFVDVCVVGGMNIKATDGSGYTKCLEMFMRLIEMQNQDIGDFNMYCPATGNALRSITDTSQVGDVCGGTSDTYIEYGHVTLKTDDKNGQHKYVCTCTPQSCKDGYYWNKEKYQCSVKDKEGYCVRHILGSFEYKNGKLPTDSGVGLNDWNKRNNAYYNDKYAQINASTDAFNRCVEYGANQGCRIRGALASADVSSGFGTAKKYQVICNPENYEIAADKKVQEEKEQRHKAELAENSNYYEVCGKDKGRGTCIDNVFTRRIIGGTQVSYAVGNALVKEYMRVKGYNGVKDEITCGGDNYDNNIRKETIAGMRAEYYIRCKSLRDATKYYEFKFDDLEESKDLTANTSVYNAVWHIIYDYQLAKNSHNGYDTKTKANCDAVGASFKKICNGCGTEWRESGYIETKGKKFCYDVINIADNTTCKKSPNDLNTAFDMDPFVFCKNTHNQLKNTGSMESLLKQYISDKSGYNVSKIECYPQTLCYSGTGCGGVIGHGDDIKTCVVHGDKDYTIDFVFDDVNEFSKKLTKGALQSMACVVSGGTFAGQECIMANEQQCKKLSDSMKNICFDCKAPKWNTQTKLCELADAATVTKLEKGKTVAMIVGGTIVAIGVTVITLGEGAPVAVLVLSGLDIIGGGIELGSQISIDGMAHDFLLKSINCQDANCAERILKEDLQEMANIMNDMTDPEINATDTEFARLVGLIPQDSDFYKRIVEQGATLEANQKGFFDPEGWNAAQVWRAVGIGLQLSSLGSGFITKIASSSRFANKFPKMQKALTKEVKLVRDGIIKTDNAMVTMDMWTGATSGTGNSLQKELTLLEELKDARQGKTGARLSSAVLEDLSAETKMLLAQNGNDVDAVIRQMSKGLESVNQNTLVLNRELQLLDELENAKQAKTGSRMYSGVYEDLSEETKRLLAQNGNDISKARQRLNLAAQKLKYKPGNQTLGDFILSPDLESIGGEYSTWNSGLSKLKKDVVTKQANGEDATQALAKLRSAASDAVDAQLIEQNAIFYKENIARILASDEDLLKQFNNFENLSHGEKERFIRTFINRHGANLGVSEDVEISLISKFADEPEAIGRCCGVNNITGKRIIYISEDNLIKAGNGSAKNGLIAAPSHEYGHFVDRVDPNKGVLGSQVSDISQNFYGKQSNKTLEGWLTYTSRPTEKSSFPIGYIVRDDFSGGLRQTITAGKMPTTTISKIDDFKIKYAVPNINPTYVENGGDAYFFIQARPENITGLSNYFRQKGLRVKTTSDGVRVFEIP